MNTPARLSGVHLVGSVPVDGAEEMFRLSMRHLGGHLKRMPDGEAGERDTWIRWQYAKIGASPQMRPTELDNAYVPVPPYAVAEGITNAEQIEFPNLGYADAAMESFAIYEALTKDGVIPAEMRFQVGLPTPLSVAIFYLVAIYKIYEAANLVIGEAGATLVVQVGQFFE